MLKYTLSNFAMYFIMGAFWPELYYFFVFFTSFWKSFWSKKSSKNANIREGLQLSNQLNLKILKFPAIIIILQVDNWLENQNKNANSTLCSQAVSHPSTNRAQCCLTSVIGRELVHSAWYGRWLRKGWQRGIMKQLKQFLSTFIFFITS